jgi:N-acylglucosamine 2-epimerase
MQRPLRASQDDQWLVLAKKIYLKCFSRYDSEDYELAGEKIKGPRVLNHWMILLRNATQMLELKADPEIEKLADRCVDAILNHHLNPEYNLLNVTLTHDLKPVPGGSYSQTVSFGLAIQALWMIMFEAVRRKKDEALFQKARDLFKRHVDVARDKVYGGYFGVLDNVKTFTFQLNKTLSVQDEVLIGSAFLMEHDKWAETCFLETHQYVSEKFVRPEYAFAIEGGNRTMTEYGKKSMGIYHHPRQLMFVLLALERMLK